MFKIKLGEKWTLQIYISSQNLGDDKNTAN